jgi:hypothetical protein
LNADKLPKLIEGGDLAVDIPPNIIPDIVMKKKETQKLQT